jgi:uncharacterized membrane protein
VPLFIMLIVSVMLAVGAAMQCFATLTFRPGLFFGVTVDREFMQSENAQRIVWRYRRPILVVTVLCAAALWIVVPHLNGLAAPLSVSAIVVLEVGTAIVSMALASRRVRAFAKPHSAIRTASLVPGHRALPGGFLPFAGPMIITAVGVVLLLTRRDLIPAETYRGALALLLPAFVSTVLFMWVNWMATFRMRLANGSLAARGKSDRRMGYLVRLVIAYMFALYWVYLSLAVADIAPVTKGAGPVAILVSGWLIIVALVGFHLVRNRKVRASEEFNGDATPDASWKWGLIYYNPDDPALVVEARAGKFGCDLNFGNKWSWIISGGLVALPFLIRLVWF